MEQAIKDELIKILKMKKYQIAGESSSGVIAEYSILIMDEGNKFLRNLLGLFGLWAAKLQVPAMSNTKVQQLVIFTLSERKDLEEFFTERAGRLCL